MEDKLGGDCSRYALGYTRVSDIGQLRCGHSFEEQPEMLQEFATQQGYTIQAIFSDEAKSATNLRNRKGMLDALEYITEHPEIEAFIVQDTDRLARNESDHFAIQAHLRKHNVKLISKNQPGINDSPEGKLVDSIVAGVNAFQSRLSGRKVSHGLERQAMKGRTVRMAPLGYSNVNLGTLKEPIKTVQLNPKTAPIVKEMFETFATGNYSVVDMVKILQKKGVKSTRGNKMHRSVLTTTLRNPYYIGKLIHKESIYEGQHEPLIDKATFYKCVSVLESHNQGATRRRKPGNLKKFYARGYIYCARCGKRLTGVSPAGKNVDYYHCSTKKEDKGYHSNKGQCISPEKLHEDISNLFQFEVEKGMQINLIKRIDEMVKERDYFQNLKKKN